MITSVSPVTRRYVREFFLRLAVFGLVLLTRVFAPGRLTFTAPFRWSRWPLAVLWARCSSPWRPSSTPTAVSPPGA